ncbi:hypothetical protein [Bradyrhizobium sp. BR 1432]|uniref:hypothetical protein n=1 Tax=Bradyrhizobium sp. BR 1432 TaxID=3447966 RepID=UPI003EE6763D
MANANTNTGNLDPLFHPAAHYASADDVLNDDELSVPEKRSSCRLGRPTCSQWNSCPALREIPGMVRAIRLVDILAALRRLDGDDDDPSRGDVVPMRLRRTWAAALRRSA